MFIPSIYLLFHSIHTNRNSGILGSNDKCPVQAQSLTLEGIGSGNVMSVCVCLTHPMCVCACVWGGLLFALCVSVCGCGCLG